MILLACSVVAVNAAPPNKGMELIDKSIAPFARGRATGAPLSPAAHPPWSVGTETHMTTVIPLRDRPDLCAFFAEQFEAEWPDWYGRGGRGDAAADLIAFANPAGELPVGVVALDHSGAPVGIAALKATSIDTYKHVSPWAAAGYVLPVRRREGIGASLLSALLVEARRLRFHTVYCATASAVTLLEREGWSQIDAVMHEGGTQFIFRRVVPSAA